MIAIKTSLLFPIICAVALAVVAPSSPEAIVAVVPPALNQTSVVSVPAVSYDRHLVTAHRGSSASAPENTVSAFLKAVEEGAGYSELDVQETSDGVLMVMHDDNLRRTTGMNRNMWDITSDQLKQASAGEWFDKKYKNERVPTLEETIRAVKGKSRLNIELKNNGHQIKLAERAVKAIQDLQFGGDCTITSFDVKLLRQVKQLDNSIKTGLIVGEKPAQWESVMSSPDYEVISAAYPLLNSELMKLAARHHKEVYAWTVNDSAVMSAMLDLGVSSVITNDPARLVQVLKKRAAHPSI